MDLRSPVSARRSNPEIEDGWPGRRYRTAGRRVAMLGGITSFSDCAAAASFLFRPHRLICGPHLRQYESAFADYVGVRHGYSFSTGRVALYGILKGLGIGDGDDVIIGVPTHIVIPNAVSYTGARPVFVDSSARTCNMDVAALAQGITDRTKAVLVQHTFGVPADLDAILRIGRERGIAVIEDCVHALGATYRGARVGSLGRAALFSTEETKTISTTMGGMAVTDDNELARRLEEFQQRCDLPPRWLTVRYLAKLVAYHVLTEPHLHRFTRPLYEAFGSRNPLPRATTEEEINGKLPPGYERRLSNSQALLGLRQLRRIDANIAHREGIATAFRSRLEALGFDMPEPPPFSAPAYVRVPVNVTDRQAAVRAASRHAVLGTWFTSVLEEAADPCVGGYVAGSCPTAELLAQHLVNMPTHRRVSLRDVDAVVAALAECEKGRT